MRDARGSWLLRVGRRIRQASLNEALNAFRAFGAGAAVEIALRAGA